MNTVSLRHDGIVRHYSAWLPDRAATAPAPVLLLFHGWSSSAEAISASSSLPRAAAAQGWLVVVPQGSGSPSRWVVPGLDGPDDVDFAVRILDDAETRWSIDRTRVAIAGFSNGAAFAARLACHIDVVGIALVGGAGLGAACTHETRATVVLAHGADDAVVRMDGGPVLGGRLQARPFADAVEAWMATGAAVDAITVPGWGHTWPPEATTATLQMLATTFDV